MDDGLTAILGRTAQVSVVRMAGSAVADVDVAGGGLAWTLVADVILGGSVVGSDIGTAVGAGLLIALGNTWWALSR